MTAKLKKTSQQFTRNKKTTARQNTEINKKTKLVVDPNSYLQKKPSWHFNRVDKEKWPLNSIDKELFSKLSDIETMTWAEIKHAKKKHHTVDVSGMNKSAKDRLCERKMEDIDEMFSFCLKGTHRLYGIISDGEFYAIWNDLKHEVYPSEKKHT